MSQCLAVQIYSRLLQFIHGLQQAGIDLDRKALAHLAMEEPELFAKIAGEAKEKLAA